MTEQTATEQNQEPTMYQLADEFIALANKLSQQHKDLGKTGAALRFAAARFNAFEASVKTQELEKEKEHALEWFSNEFKQMLEVNLDDHIAMAKRQQEEGNK
ncbi:DUF3144 domain-containing protein [Paraferrimonas sedimenticola]|uniref:DUF3144 domain-containing protein n=1 Tax=Paraferrimonas sedimenticola TaxID=375674 RepID=A0AA37RXH0_9GAMM|nr:DUF3144 domain-containing protein [Paraferrimonas sedimenticola]GLP97266.1 hypothetical protein GCM10007895_25730 [Paraferrimonas sedimenticola]